MKQKLFVRPLPQNDTRGKILLHILEAAVSLFFNGFGVYLTILAGIGAAPWDVLNLGLSHTFGLLYGNASVAVSLLILLVDIALRGPIMQAAFISVRFDATAVRHQNLHQSLRVFFPRRESGDPHA